MLTDPASADKSATLRSEIADNNGKFPVSGNSSGKYKIIAFVEADDRLGDRPQAIQELSAKEPMWKLIKAGSNPATDLVVADGME